MNDSIKLNYPKNISVMNIITGALTSYNEFRTIDLNSKKNGDKKKELNDVRTNQAAELEILNLLLFSKLYKLKNADFEKCCEALDSAEILLIIRALFHSNPTLHLTLIQRLSEQTISNKSIDQLRESYGV